MSQTELAQRLGIKKQNITGWLRSEKIPVKHKKELDDIKKQIGVKQ